MTKRKTNQSELKLSWATKRLFMALIDDAEKRGDKPATLQTAINKVDELYNPDDDEMGLVKDEVHRVVLRDGWQSDTALEHFVTRKDWRKRSAEEAKLDPEPETTYKTVQGYEFPDHLLFSDDAVFILGHVRRRGAAYIQVDDSSDDHETVHQLNRAAGEGYFSMVEVSGHGWLLIEPDRFEVRFH